MNQTLVTNKKISTKTTTKKKCKIVNKKGTAFSIFGPATGGDVYEQNITVNKIDDFVSHMVYSFTNSLKVHDFLKGKDISKDVKECFEHKIEDKKGKERLSESFLEECLEAAKSDVENGKWPIKIKVGCDEKMQRELEGIKNVYYTKQ